MVKMENALQTRKQIADQCWQQIRELLPLLDKAQRFETKDNLMFWGKEQLWLSPWSDSEKKKNGQNFATDTHIWVGKWMHAALPSWIIHGRIETRKSVTRICRWRKL